MLDNFLVKYFQKGDNFKIIYSLLVENSIPESMKEERYKAEEGFSTNVGFKLHEDDEQNKEVWIREINVFNKQTLQNYIECVQELYTFQTKHQIMWK